MDQIEIAGVPAPGTPMPEPIARIALGPLTPVWQNQLGGLTFFEQPVEDSAPGRYLKWVPNGTPELDLRAEAERLSWAAARGAHVPVVLEQGGDATGDWLVTAALQGDSAVSARWITTPEIAAFEIGIGLRDLHDRLDPRDCPFDWSIDRRLSQARARLDRGLGQAEWAPEHSGLSVAEAWELLADPPPIDRLVVCHGDACAPNTLIGDDGRFTAHVDLGALGVADRWADLAVAAWSTVWNYGEGYENFVYEGYGIAPDPARIAYYRLLWDLS